MFDFPSEILLQNCWVMSAYPSEVYGNAALLLTETKLLALFKQIAVVSCTVQWLVVTKTKPGWVKSCQQTDSLQTLWAGLETAAAVDPAASWFILVSQLQHRHFGPVLPRRPADSSAQYGAFFFSRRKNHHTACLNKPRPSLYWLHQSRCKCIPAPALPNSQQHILCIKLSNHNFWNYTSYRMLPIPPKKERILQVWRIAVGKDLWSVIVSGIVFTWTWMQQSSHSSLTSTFFLILFFLNLMRLAGTGMLEGHS